MNTIWVVEFREKVSGSRKTEYDIAGLFTSKEKAEQFIKKNPDYSNAQNVWWWAIYTEKVDSEMPYMEHIELHLYDRYGYEMENQP